MIFQSEFKEVGSLAIPGFYETRIQLMPAIMHDADSLPDKLAEWRPFYSELCSLVPTATGTGYLTIDQRYVRQGKCHRRPGLHVDGAGVWGQGTWASRGMLVVSDVVGCAAWQQEFNGTPVEPTDPGDPSEGLCEHLRDQLQQDCRTELQPNRVYWCGPLCVHESLSVATDCQRTFVRLSLPSGGVWPSNCTPNPKVLPGGLQESHGELQESLRMTLTYITICDGCGVKRDGWQDEELSLGFAVVSFTDGGGQQEHYCPVCWTQMTAVLPSKAASG